MLFLFLFRFSSSVLSKCIASKQISKVPDTYKIVQNLLIINSGSHSPKTTYLSRERRGIWLCDSKNAHSKHTNVFPLDLSRYYKSVIDKRYANYPPNCGINDLTIEGMNQIHNLAEKYRDFITNYDQTFFTNFSHEKQLTIRSTVTDNSFQNAVSFLTGFLKDKSIDHNGINVISGSLYKEVIIPNENHCKDIKSLIEQFESSEKCKNLIVEAKKDLKDVISYLNITQMNRNTVIDLCEWIYSMHCHEQILDFNITDSLFEKVKTYYAELRYGPYYLKEGVASSSILREIINAFNETSSQVKFTLFSADDSSFAALFAFLKYKIVDIPFASHLSFVLLEKQGELFVQIAFNGEILKISNNETMIPYKDFVNLSKESVGFC